MKKHLVSLIMGIWIWALSSAFAMETSDEEKKTSFRTWSFLTEEEVVEIIAPAAAPTSQKQIDRGLEVIKENGLVAYLAEGAIKQEDSYYEYYANSDEKRARYFIEALQGKVKALWAVRGGFGCAEDIDILESSSFILPDQPKLIIGCSDITALHLLADTWGWISLHASVFGFNKELFPVTGVNVNKNAELQSVFRILTGKDKKVTYPVKVLHPGAIPSKHTISGSVMGGNLSIIVSHNGTPTALRGEDRFILLEDTLEDKKRFNRNLLSLKRAGVFKKAKGIIFGNIPLTEHGDSQKETEEAIMRFVNGSLKRINIPVVYSNRFGHGEYNDPLPLGTKALLTIDGENATLTPTLDKKGNMVG